MSVRVYREHPWYRPHLTAAIEVLDKLELTLLYMEIFQTLFEDPNILVINKPAGLAVETGTGVRDQTLEDLLKESGYGGLARSGIVHRLDRDTTGVMVIAKNEKSYVALKSQFADRDPEKIYYAIACGDLVPREGTIHIALKRDERNRVRFVPSQMQDSKDAITHYVVEKSGKINDYDLVFVKIRLETGRTHQIRAHFLAIGHPLLGDQVYWNQQSKMISDTLDIKRQMLHASTLTLKHPTTGKKMTFEAPLPEDIINIMKRLK